MIVICDLDNIKRIFCQTPNGMKRGIMLNPHSIIGILAAIRIFAK